LFEEQIKKEELKFKKVIAGTTKAFPEALDYFPDVDDFNIGTDEYLENIRIAKERGNIHVIASLNGKTKNDIETVHEIDMLTLESGIAVKSNYHYCAGYISA